MGLDLLCLSHFENHQMISILIPTLNRNDILLKTIKYYEKQKFDGELIMVTQVTIIASKN